ncbi:MAG: GMC family oxidoreductase [Acidimicrobiia bacterium]|nr:GMC family oxidoreductase [Acidimicrobiia bacterium]
MRSLARAQGRAKISGTDYDVVVIGSGFGGSVAALRLTEKGYRVGVLEAGKRWDASSLPTTNWNLRKFLWFPKLGMRGIQRLSLLNHALALSGAGVGGGSLVWGNVCYEPHGVALRDPQWGHITDWEKELAPHFDQARRMLGVHSIPKESAADGVLRSVAAHFGVQETFTLTPVAVHFGKRGIEEPDPYFGGEGPTRTGCIECGGCMVGCRHNAKNTLDKNYLYLAEKHGAVIHPEHQAVDVVPLEGGGYRVVTERPGAWFRKRSRSFATRQVVFAAGALGTARLLHCLRESGRLPNLSPRLGHHVRTNSETILGAVASDTSVDYSKGVAITSSIHPEPQTHIEAVRYPAGSNAMGLLATIIVDGGTGVPRWARFLGACLRHPVTFLRSLSVYRWSERAVIFLVMQSLDNSLRLRFRKGLLGWRPITEQETGKPSPTYIPVANEAARVAAARISGQPMSSINEVLLDAPVTAHLLGGACIGDSHDSGVIDAYHRVFGYDGLHVIDGSAVTANLGANPSLTITAMAERSIALWPNLGGADPRPPLGEPYQRLEPVAPVRPVVPAGAPGSLEQP